MTAQPPVIENTAQTWKPGTGQDPARFLVDPNTALYHQPPTFRVGDAIFRFPITEGFTRSGSAQLGIHHYLGDDVPVVQVTHRGDRRIELTGTFPGRTSPENMRDLEVLLNSPTPSGGKKLFIPGVFSNEQVVEVESYNFTHDAEDQTHSIAYTVTFIITGIGQKINDPHGNPPPPNPVPRTKVRPRGRDFKEITTQDNFQTVRSIASAVYSNPEASAAVVSRNRLTLLGASGLEMPMYQLTSRRLPIGVRLYY